MHKKYRYWLGSLLIIAMAAGLYLAGSGKVALWDRDEAWYAQTSRQMLEGGNWIVPHFLTQPRYAKPIFIYWCQAASMHFFGVNSFAARLPSAIGMTLTLILLAVVLSWKVGARRAMWTTLIFASSAMVIVSAKMCLTDAVMMVFITGAQFCLFGIYRARTGRRGDGNFGLGIADFGPAPTSANQTPKSTTKLALLMWICIGMAGLTKGPFVLAVLLGAMILLACLDVGRQWRSAAAWKKTLHWWRATRPLWGLGIIFIIVAPWLIAFAITNPHALWEMLQEPAKHMATNKDGHAQPPGYYLATIWLILFPWSLLLPAALVLGWKHRRTAAIRFCLATIVGNWVFVEFFMLTKLPHYMLPSYAAFAFLIATALMRCMRGQHGDLHNAPFRVGAGGWAMGAALLAMAPWLLAGFFPGQFSYAAAGAFTGVGLLWAFLVMGFFMQRKLASAAATMGIGMIVVIAIFFQMYLPRATFLRVPVEVGKTLVAQGATAEGAAVMTDFNEPSVAFYQGGTITDGAGQYLKKVPIDQWPRWIVLTRRAYDRLPAPEQARLKEVAHYKGLNYAGGGKIVDVMVAEKTPTATASASEAVGGGQ
jgi:4-amino-4-deoxy-L-arabinose transferase-like glycosyltransferase